MKDQQQTILVADDEASIRRILETRLSMMGFVVITAADGEEALQVFQHQEPDLIILDVMMPKLNGYQVCQSLRQESDVPIIMLTALSDVADRITGLEMGADDYMVKPFSPKELESRIRCILRRITKSHASHQTSAGVIQVGHLEIDTNKRQVYKDQERIQLTHLEFNLLELLVSRPGEPISRVEFLQKVWGYSPDGKIDTRVVDVHMSRLRNKLKEDTEEPDLILSVRGVGYAIQRGE
ncbi:response regulator transcription factor [Acaryochloris sp. 'Moss Beach']|uniref:response regulator transcription factor RpaB n=1 Tax=Acaryochloris TaxID=155977 RepID=UPI001BAF2BE0|nr:MULTISPECIES: response regulator transcription factor [Acaryochloris]QUY42717.1 response regulator transcription factor [Acaryochloris marina S15]UJB71796.1 response regulator transcription factor [Acaryochloris sp. 'Moss Beach']